MNKKVGLIWVIVALFAAQAACNFPTQTVGQATPLPGPNQTLTALFAFTPEATAETTPTLPPVVTATSGASATPDANAGGGIAVPTATTPPTATLVPPTATTVPPTATNVPPTATKVPPTATRVPPTATLPAARPRALTVANYLSTPPTIDGDWGEWKTLTKEYPANNLVWGAQNWANADDLSASFHVGWDNNNLYLAVKVRDDRYVQNATGANLYLGDSVELVFDRELQTDFYYTQLSPDDFQLGISPGRPDPAGAKEAYLWFPSNIAGSRSSVKIASLQESGVYRVEAAIPWSVLETQPVAGRHYGFSLMVNDNDDPNHNLQQKMVSNTAGYRLADPTTWGDLQLVQ